MILARWHGLVVVVAGGQGRVAITSTTPGVSSSMKTDSHSSWSSQKTVDGYPLKSIRRNMNIAQMGCCAFNEIRNLRGNTAEKAMQLFCGQAVNSTVFGPVKLRLGAFYIFTAVVDSKVRDRVAGRYGEAFANYIKQHKLGDVVKTMTRYNRKNAPDHLIQGWVWAPDEKNRTAWWKKNRGSSA